MKLIPLGIEPVNGESAFLVEAQDEAVILDAGNSIDTPLNLAPLKRIADPAFVFVTHSHRDHCGGLAEMLRLKPKLRVFSVHIKGCHALPYYVKTAVSNSTGLTAKFIPAGHCAGAAAVLLQDLMLYTGDYHCYRTFGFYGLTDFQQVPFVVSECSLLGEICPINALVPTEDFPRRRVTQFGQEMFGVRLPIGCAPNASVLDKPFMRTFISEKEYYIKHSHADFRSVVEVCDACWPETMLLVHCDRLNVCRTEKEVLESILPCHIEIVEGVVQSFEIADRCQFTIYRKRYPMKLKKFVEKCLEIGILLEQSRHIAFIGRNIFIEQHKMEIVVCWVEQAEVEIFLKILDEITFEKSDFNVQTFWG